jgi:7-cyano-7-deazaguanine synthase in queuosine biosynthesis
MRIWINKQTESEIPEEFKDAYIFNMLKANNKSTLKTDIEGLWRTFRNKDLSNINEDLLVIAISIFAADKRVSRKLFIDNWTRNFDIHIPVIEYDKWILVNEELETLIRFLIGDNWKIIFRKTNEKIRNEKTKKKYNFIEDKSFDEVSLFSGGLDSFAGAINLLEKHKRICFVGFREYGKLAKRQKELFNILDSNYPNIKKDIVVFYSTPRIPKNINNEEIKKGSENTSRSRSFLFMAGAIAVASQISENTPINIPENGFIGINVPLTDSRKGSCSTRTTHPFLINKLNRILLKVGIKNNITNLYAYKTKGEIVQELKNVKAFKDGYSLTISCSHPCQARYNGKTIPMNCGYCYPCLIRKASLNKLNDIDEEYDFDDALSIEFIKKHHKYTSKGDDVKALLSSLNRYINSSELELKTLIMQTGLLSKDELKSAYRVYKESMEEMKSLVILESKKWNEEVLEYVGIEENV